ncbi:MAG: PRA1 family protein-domain-containing protein [Monoraphidium minutum]|nr:MAG: PRA1 family protein-domain-containing protein [Monoraphidium minutum]
MDWNNVTPQELWDALRETELKAPRAAWEFFSGFSIPKNQTKWTSRLKCNVYYYISNYLLLLALCLAGFLLRRPLGLAGAGLSLLALLCFNDPFAAAVNDTVVKAVRRVNPHAASVLRNMAGTFGSQGSLGGG